MNQPPYNPYYGGQEPPPYPPGPGGGGYAPQGGGYPPQAGGYPPQGGFAPPPPVHAYGGMMGSSGGDFDSESAQPKSGMGLQFSDNSVRRAFIRKVFAIVAIQLLIVTAFIAIFVFSAGAKRFITENFWLYWVAYVVFMVTYIAMACCSSVRRKFPGNIICLALLTFAIAYMTGMITAFHKTEIVFLAMGICTVVCVTIIIFAMNTKYDLTSCMGIMFVIFMVAFVMGIIAMIFHFTKWGKGFTDTGDKIGGDIGDRKIFAKLSKILYVVYAGLMAVIFMVGIIVGGVILSPLDHMGKVECKSERLDT